MFHDANMSLPALTQAVINISKLLSNNLTIFGFIIATSFVAWRYGSKSERVLNYFNRTILKIPILGKTILQLLIIRFSRVFSALLSAGIPIVEALSISRSTIGNREFEKEISSIKDGVERGESFAQQIAMSVYFPPLASQFCHVGETTGMLDGMLVKIASFYEEETNRFFANSKQLLEPAIILFLGVVVGTLVVAMYLPILQLGQLV
jgi:type IV pilus assembly protein PilC